MRVTNCDDITKQLNNQKTKQLIKRQVQPSNISATHPHDETNLLHYKVSVKGRRYSRSWEVTYTLTDFTISGTKVPRCPLQKHSQHISDIPFPLSLGLILSFFYFSVAVQKIHTWWGSDDYFTLHSSFHTAGSKSSAVHCWLFFAQVSHAATCLSFNSDHFLTFHFLMSSIHKTLSTVDVETSGQFLSRNSRHLIVQLFFEVHITCFFAWQFSFSRRSECGRLSWFPRSCTLVKTCLTVLHDLLTILATVDMTSNI